MTRSARWLSLAPLFVLAACPAPIAPPAAPSPPRPPALAEGEGVRLTAADLRARANQEAPMTRGELRDPARRRAFLEALIDEELLVAEAKRQKLDQEPEFKATVNQMLRQRLLAARPRPAAAAPTEAELEAEYVRQKDRFTVAEKAQVQLIVMRAGPGGGGLEPLRSSLGALRETLAKQAAGDAGAREFAAAAKRSSHDAASAAAGGSLGAFTRDELAAGLGAGFADAVWALAGPGALTAVIDVPGGVALARLVGRTAAQSVPFEQLRGQLAATVSRERQQAELKAYTQALKAGAKVKVDDAALLALDLEAPPPQ